MFGCARVQALLSPRLLEYSRSKLVCASPDQVKVTSPLVMMRTFVIVSGGLGNLFVIVMLVNCGCATGALLAIIVTATATELLVAPRLSVTTAVNSWAPTAKV